MTDQEIKKLNSMAISLTNTFIDANNLLVEIKKEIDKYQPEPKKPKRWRAEKDGKYFTVGDAGTVGCRTEDLHPYDDYRYEQRNYFQTQEEGERYRDKLILKAEIRNRIEELNDGWEPDFKYGIKNYSTLIEFGEIKYDYTDISQALESWKYLKNYEVFEILKKEFGEDLKVLFE